MVAFAWLLLVVGLVWRSSTHSLIGYHYLAPRRVTLPRIGQHHPRTTTGVPHPKTPKLGKPPKTHHTRTRPPPSTHQTKPQPQPRTQPSQRTTPNTPQTPIRPEPDPTSLTYMSNTRPPVKTQRKEEDPPRKLLTGSHHTQKPQHRSTTPVINNRLTTNTHRPEPQHSHPSTCTSRITLVNRKRYPTKPEERHFPIEMREEAGIKKGCGKDATDEGKDS